MSSWYRTSTFTWLVGVEVEQLWASPSNWHGNDGKPGGLSDVKPTISPTDDTVGNSETVTVYNVPLVSAEFSGSHIWTLDFCCVTHFIVKFYTFMQLLVLMQTAQLQIATQNVIDHPNDPVCAARVAEFKQMWVIYLLAVVILSAFGILLIGRLDVRKGFTTIKNMLLQRPQRFC